VTSSSFGPRQVSRLKFAQSGSGRAERDVQRVDVNFRGGGGGGGGRGCDLNWPLAKLDRWRQRLGVRSEPSLMVQYGLAGRNGRAEAK